MWVPDIRGLCLVPLLISSVLTEAQYMLGPQETLLNPSYAYPSWLEDSHPHGMSSLDHSVLLESSEWQMAEVMFTTPNKAKQTVFFKGVGSRRLQGVWVGTTIPLA